MSRETIFGASYRIHEIGIGFQQCPQPLRDAAVRRQQQLFHRLNDPRMTQRQPGRNLCKFACLRDRSLCRDSITCTLCSYEGEEDNENVFDASESKMVRGRTPRS